MIRRLAPLVLALLLVPGMALAESAAVTVPVALSTGVGIVGLVVAIMLLLAALALRRVARGAAFAENISYVVVGVICLAAAVLAGWIARQLPADFSPDQARLAADLLVIACMVFLGIYFVRVRSAMKRFLDAAAGDEPLVRAHGVGGDGDTDG